MTGHHLQRKGARAGARFYGSLLKYSITFYLLSRHPRKEIKHASGYLAFPGAGLSPKMSLARK